VLPALFFVDSEMSSTVRAFVNNQRVATAKVWNDKFLQVYPERRVFASEAEWRASLNQRNQTVLTFDGESTPSPSVPQTRSRSVGVSTGVSQTVSLNPRDWEVQEDKKKATLPAGKYYIGDLCYALDDTLYDKVFGPRYDIGLFTSKLNPTHVFMMGRTDDGLFRGSDRKDYPVDAGIIGIAAEATLDQKKAPYDGGSLYTFKSPVNVKLRNDKFIFYGDDYNDPHLTIYIYEEDYEDSE
jgi:hypothetical protein